MTNPNPLPIGLGFGFILFGADDGLFPYQGKCHAVTKGLGGSEANAYLEPTLCWVTLPS